ncbi:hypothetical protein [Cypionkella sp.]|uniref:hypothetical protein n=1 Tax=Cypionkella sp. TaxID=2811411 RepID=UPI00262507FC|nr:hypothetical protein [Cypionkella sp.]MDB5664671.1 hypothetical protein [Cypionkella sp.]
MPLLLLLLAVSVFVYGWLARRNSTLTRDCRWRLDRTLGVSHYRCASCGAECDTGSPRQPRHCSRAQ